MNKQKKAFLNDFVRKHTATYGKKPSREMLSIASIAFKAIKKAQQE